MFLFWTNNCRMFWMGQSYLKLNSNEKDTSDWCLSRYLYRPGPRWMVLICWRHNEPKRWRFGGQCEYGWLFHILIWTPCPNHHYWAQIFVQSKDLRKYHVRENSLFKLDNKRITKHFNHNHEGSGQQITVISMLFNERDSKKSASVCSIVYRLHHPSSKKI